MGITKSIGYLCERCGHTWTPRKEDVPKVCPNQKCHSPWWNKKRA